MFIDDHGSDISEPLFRKKLKREIIILDTTLRDGSYAIDFKFTLDDTRKIASALENAGIKQIEIGHGWGLNAAAHGLGKASHSDIDYIRAAREVLNKAKFGCFFIPKVAGVGDLVMSRELGMDFVRIGNNITEYKEQESYINSAKNLGFHVSSNLLKSYVVTPDEFALRAVHVADMGADVVVLVDSAGGMTPDEVKQYIQAARNRTDIPLGFHGHNNLGLANANTLAAIDSGASVIDTTLQGIGRSAGNAITESIVLLLERRGIETGIDPYVLFDTGEKYIKPLLQKKGGYDPTDFVLGHSRFHSSFVPMIKKVAREYSIDYRRLIIEVAKIDRVKPSEEMIRLTAERLSSMKSIRKIDKEFQPKQMKHQFFSSRKL